MNDVASAVEAVNAFRRRGFRSCYRDGRISVYNVEGEVGRKTIVTPATKEVIAT